MNDEILRELAELRRATQTTPPKKVIQLLTKYGFVQKRAVGGRQYFAHPGRLGLVVVVPDGSPMRPRYVKSVADAIEEVMFDDAP
jgi:predicted RNA binding protein YcfA (HicA-like mRNA interferase family)